VDFLDLIGKPVRLKLKNGQTLIGFIQHWKDTSLLNQQVPFLQDKNQIRLQERYGKDFKVELPIGAVRELIDLINPNEIDDVEIIETEIHSIHTVTEGGKKIGIPGFKIELSGTGKLGRVGASYWLPENDKKFELGELEIKDSTVWLPVTTAFISYAKEDVKKVTAISNDLSNNGILPWFDKEMLLPGDDWQNRIEEAIEAADYFLLFMSSQTIDRNGFKNRELQLALYQQSLRPEGKRFIIPILIDDCKPPRELRKLHWLKTTDEGWFKKILKAIAPLHIKKELK
jgi:hypothetical protein